MKSEIIDAKVEFFHRSFRKPLQLSSGIITEITEARAEVVVQVGGRKVSGKGAIYLSDLWSWPDPAYTHTERDSKLRKFCEQIAANLKERCGKGSQHPLEHGLRLHESISEKGEMPILARAMCASPFDA